MSKQQIEKISIKGAPPAWDDEEYLRRLDMEIHMYRNTSACLEMVRAPLEFQFLNLVIEKAQRGYKVSPRYPVDHGQLSHTVWMSKPDDVENADINQIKQKVKDEYIAHLQSEHQRYQDLLREQLLAAVNDKARVQREREEAKKLDAINKEVEACYSPLVIPESIPERKAAEFSTDMQG